jgi:hypothetical protein
MPPKPAGKGAASGAAAAKAKKKNGAGGSGGGGGEDDVLPLEDQKTLLLRQLESVRHQLALEGFRASQAEGEARELRQRARALEDALAEERKTTAALAADMTRQYKVMREELLDQVQALRGEVARQKDLLEEEKLRTHDVERRKDQEIAMHEAKIAELTATMEEMSQEFSRMLKQTLEKMSERVAITNEWDAAQHAAGSAGAGQSGVAASAPGAEGGAKEGLAVVRALEAYDLSLTASH